MVEVSGSATIRAGTYDAKVWQLLEDDGETPYDLTGKEVIMRLQHVGTKQVTEYKTVDALRLFVIDAPLGKVQLLPEGDFAAAGRYRFHFIVVDGDGNHPFPEDKDEDLQVLDGYPPAT